MDTTVTGNDVAHTLNNLIETAKDGQLGFDKAAQEANESSLKTLFVKYSSQRSQYVSELQQLVQQLGAKAETSGSLAASIHRGWIDVKKAVSKREDTAIIDECEAGEDAAMKNYKEALATALPSDVMTVVQRQFAGVQEAHNTIRDMKHARHANS